LKYNSNFCPALDRGSYGYFINQTPFLSLLNPQHVHITDCLLACLLA